MNGLILAAQIERVSTRKDRTVAVTLGSQELTPSKAGELLAFANQLVCVYISPKETVTQNEIDQVDRLNPEFEGKTQSQRLRNVLYRLFEQNAEGYKDFDGFYRHHTDKIIDHLKLKISA